MRRTFQNGRVSTRSYARFTALTIVPIAPLAAHTAPSKPATNAITDALPCESFWSPSMK